MRYAQVIIDIASEQVDKLFTYRIPAGLEGRIGEGFRVKVPFGPRLKEGYIVGVTDACDLPPERIKDVQEALEPYPALLPSLLHIASMIRSETHCPLCEALRLMIPAEMRGERIHEKSETCLVLTVGREQVGALIENEKRSEKRRLILTALSDGEIHPVSEIASLVRSWREPVRALKEKGLVEIVQRESFRRPKAYPAEDRGNDPELTDEQREALDEMLPALRRGEKGRTFLLHGVTGSGKTEVYIRLVREAISLGKTALILVPEISLTPQMVSWLHARFGDDLAVLHSRLTAGERFDEWRRIRHGLARIVVGARSAVFAPLENLGVVIVDEEHEGSYLSDHYPQYDARKIARERVCNEGGILLLASATPSILSYAKAQRGDYTLLEMPHRVLSRPLPQVEILDMREELRRGNRSIFSEKLVSELEACIGQGEQAVLFLNRRGYAPFVSCRKCGETVKCLQCDVSMTYHQSDGKLHCHYCGAVSPYPERCPSCKSTYIKLCGIGTQRVEEEVKKRFPQAATIRMDLDTTKGRNAHAELLERFRAKEAQVLIGTQMITKGLDFPSVTLVGAVLADMTLNLPDYRSAERTYQLLVQAAGRAGRGMLPGKVIIQTYKPEHYAIAEAARQDYRAFFKMEFAKRRQDLYPPFTQIDRILIEGREEDAVMKAAETFREKTEAFLTEHPEIARLVFFLRADAAPIERIQGRHRAHMIIKMVDSEKCAPLIHFMTECIRKEAGGERVRAFLEINPPSLA
ncbi:MAG: primosomal protein N' [Clostridia bacterium]|nr:primosomal protein N' [Clostridia bacterium]